MQGDEKRPSSHSSYNPIPHPPDPPTYSLVPISSLDSMQHVVCYTTSSAHFGVACTKRVARCSKRHTSFQCPKTHARRTAVLIRAQDAPKPAAQEDDFEARIAALKVAKGQTPMGEGKKKGTSVSKAPASASSAKVCECSGGAVVHRMHIPLMHIPPPTLLLLQVDYDYTNEKVYLETPPSYGDLAVNMALGFTLVWLPLTIAAVGRTAFVRYRFTDQRISVITNAPWKQEQLDAAYQEVCWVLV